jgi:hypothetical protein
VVRRPARSGLRRKKGAIVTLYTAPPADSVVIGLDEMGPESAKRFPGTRLVANDSAGIPRPRATQEIDDGRRGRGDLFGAFAPATGEALTVPDPRRTITHGIAFLEEVAGWLDPHIARIDAVLDNLPTHCAVDVLLWALAHPRWACVFQPKDAAYRNLIEPWWKILRSLARKGRRFATWVEVCQAVAAATPYGKAHGHPFLWGRRTHRRPARVAGIAHLPTAA